MFSQGFANAACGFVDFPLVVFFLCSVCFFFQRFRFRMQIGYLTKHKAHREEKEEIVMRANKLKFVV